MKVSTLSDMLMELKGTPEKKVGSIVSLFGIYGRDCTEENILLLFSEYEELEGYSPQSIADYISICISKKINLTWEENIAKILRGI